MSQLGCMEPSGQAARFPASLPAPSPAAAVSQPSPGNHGQGAQAAEWGEGLGRDGGVPGKEGLEDWIPGTYGLLQFAAISRQQKRDVLRRMFEMWGAEPSFLRGPNWPSSIWCPLPDLEAFGSPEPRLPKARKLARPQRLPFIALFPLSSPSRTWAEQVSSTLFSPPPPPPPPLNPSRTQVSKPGKTPSLDPGVKAPRPQLGWGAHPLREPDPAASPHSSPAGCGSFSMGRGRVSGGGAGAGRARGGRTPPSRGLAHRARGTHRRFRDSGGDCGGLTCDDSSLGRRVGHEVGSDSAW